MFFAFGTQNQWNLFFGFSTEFFILQLVLGADTSCALTMCFKFILWYLNIIHFILLLEVGLHEQQLVPYIYSRNTNVELSKEVSISRLYINMTVKYAVCCLCVIFIGCFFNIMNEKTAKHWHNEHIKLAVVWDLVQL